MGRMKEWAMDQEPLDDSFEQMLADPVSRAEYELWCAETAVSNAKQTLEKVLKLRAAAHAIVTLTGDKNA